MTACNFALLSPPETFLSPVIHDSAIDCSPGQNTGLSNFLCAGKKIMNFGGWKQTYKSTWHGLKSRNTLMTAPVSR